MDLDFIEELPTVFNILKYNPDAIVDDTAIERLLNWLEQVCTQRNPRLADKSLDFLESEEIWNHTLTLSFVLRYSGYLGHHYGRTNERLADTIKVMLQNVIKHQQFTEPTVQYGFYKCLLSLSKDLFWCPFLDDFLETTLESFKKSYLYVKKAAISYFSSYLYTILFNESESISVVHNMIKPISDPDQLCHIVESISFVSEMDIHLSLKYLSHSNLIKSLISNMKSKKIQTTLQMVESLRSVFSILTRPELDVDWEYLLYEDNVEEFLLDFIRHVKRLDGLEVKIPSFCESLMRTSVNGRVFSTGWNCKLLQLALLDFAYHDDSLMQLIDKDFVNDFGKDIGAKSWKKFLMITMNEMITIERKVAMDPSCKQLLKLWRMYCLKILTVSLQNNLDDIIIDDYLASVMYDKKVPRLCFQYLKEMDFLTFDEELKNEFLLCLWDCLNCHTDSPQIVCSSLEIFSKYICQNKDNLGLVISCQSSCNSMNLSLADTLNKLLWDASWEVKDSLIDVLMKILDNAKADSKICRCFLEENIFWVKAIDLIDNQESYIRAKTVSFMGNVVLYKPIWEVFCEKCSYCMLDIWKLLHKTFTSELRQDDIFTRRSTLQVIKTWVLSNLEYICVLSSSEMNESNEKSNNNEDMRQILFDILINGSRDFDWEVRKLTFTMWTAIATVSSEKSTDEKDWFLSLFVDSDFTFTICSGVCDCEYLVKMEALQCLKYLKSQFVNIGNRETVRKSEASPEKSITSFNDYEACLSDVKQMRTIAEFEDFIERVDLESLGNQLDVLDATVSSDPVSFVQDIIASAKQSDANLLDCY